MRILIGSTRPAKVDGARDAVAAVDARFRSATLVAHDVADVAPRMPMSAAQIVGGARRRAEALLARQGPAGEGEIVLAVGLEGGVDATPAAGAAWTLQTWAAVSDGMRWGYGGGPAVLLPPRVAERVAAGEELGDIVDDLAGEAVRGTRGGWGVLTRDLIGRRDAFRLAVVAALAPFYNHTLWE
jgi:inosine/xanthosine triphosphatase